MKKDIFKSLVGYGLCYLIQFILFPTIGVADESIGAVYIISSIIFSCLWYVLLSKKFTCLLISCIAYFVLIALYHPKGIYGIGMVGINLGPEAQTHFDKSQDFLGVILVAIFFLVIQIIMWIIEKIIDILKNKLNQKSSKQNEIL
jgi:hypothetical protein